jgi:hypothetical protein
MTTTNLLAPVLNDFGLTYCCYYDEVVAEMTAEGVEYSCGDCGAEVDAH